MNNSDERQTRRTDDTFVPSKTARAMNPEDLQAADTLYAALVLLKSHSDALTTYGERREAMRKIALSLAYDGLFAALNHAACHGRDLAAEAALDRLLGR